MSRFLSLFTRRLSTDAFDSRIGQWCCFATAPLILMLAFYKISRLTLTEGESFIALMVSIGVAFQPVILGFVLPLAQSRKSDRIPPEELV